jgi:hypothetical protein
MIATDLSLHKVVGLKVFGFYILLQQLFKQENKDISKDILVMSLDDWAYELSMNRPSVVNNLSQLAAHNVIVMERKESTILVKFCGMLTNMGRGDYNLGEGGKGVEGYSVVANQGGGVTSDNSKTNYHEIRSKTCNQNILTPSHFNAVENSQELKITQILPKRPCPYLNHSDPKICCHDVYCTFGDFWANYKNKSNRFNAHTAYRRVIKRSPMLATVILDDVPNRNEKHAPWKNVKFIPHATTFLNGYLWEDDIVEEEYGTSHRQFSQRSAKIHSFESHAERNQRKREDIRAQQNSREYIVTDVDLPNGY